MTGCAARRRELGRCLRSYRDLVRPAQVGLPVAGRRRAPGLRREEVAALAGVGVSWYTWLEQGRVTASDQVLEAVGRVLGIDDVGREHLRALSRPVGPGSATAADDLRPLLDSWPSDPAVLLDARMDVVAANEAWTSVWGEPDGRHVLELLVAGQVSCDALVRALARRFRMVTDLDPVDGRLAGIRALVRAAAPDLGPVWDCRGVGAFGRPGIRLDGTDRVAYLLGELGAATPGAPAVLTLVPSAPAVLSTLSAPALPTRTPGRFDHGRTALTSS